MPWCPVAFLLLHEQPLIVPHVACCIVVVMKLEMVFCRGNMRSLPPLYPSVGTVASMETVCRARPHPLSSLVDPTQTIADAVFRVFRTVLRCWSKWVVGMSWG